MQVETDFCLHPMKLNCSSIASSTPGNNVSFPEGELVRFEVFDKQQIPKTERTNAGHKKRLTIEINDSYDFNQSMPDPMEENYGEYSNQKQRDQYNAHFFKKHQTNEQNKKYCIGESQSPSFATSISQIQSNKVIFYNSFLEQKLKQLQSQNNCLKKSLNEEKSQTKSLKVQNEALKTAFKKKQQLLIHQKEKNHKLSQKIAQLEQKSAQHHFYDEKLRQKQNKIQQILRKLQKTTNMNKTYQRQLKQGEKKILELEKEQQRTFCQNQQQAINRIKQSSVKVKEASLKSKELISNKQNQNANIMGNTLGNSLGSTVQMRKSIEKKKNSQSQGKKKVIQATQTTSTLRCQRVSSSSNIMTKKLLNLKRQ